jgi:hypothetical protein
MIYNPYPEVELPFGKDNKWFVYLFDSIVRVDESFIVYDIEDVDKVDAPKVIETKSHLERVFAYELYRQWMNHLEEKGVRNLVVNGEVGKYLKDEFEKESKDDDKRSRDNFPDLVLHKSQGNDEKQIMVCEIKREEVNDSDLLLDLFKLSCYTSEKIFWKEPFKYGVFIFEGKEASLSKLRIKPYTTTKFKGKEVSIEEYKNNEFFKKNFSNIICVSYDGTNLEYVQLDKVIDKINRED